MKKIIFILLIAFFACSFANKNSFSFFKKEKKDTTIIALVGNISIQFAGPQNTNTSEIAIQVIQASWQNNAQYDSIEIFRSSVSDTNFQFINTIAGNSVTYIDSSKWSRCADSSAGFATGTENYYKIVGFKNGFSAININSLKWFAFASAIISLAPIILSITAISNTKDSIRYEGLISGDSATYNVFRSQDSLINYQLISAKGAHGGVTIDYAIDSDLISGQKYFYKVNISDRLCESTAYSPIKSITMP